MKKTLTLKELLRQTNHFGKPALRLTISEAKIEERVQNLFQDARNKGITDLTIEKARERIRTHAHNHPQLYQADKGDYGV